MKAGDELVLNWTFDGNSWPSTMGSLVTFLQRPKTASGTRKTVDSGVRLIRLAVLCFAGNIKYGAHRAMRASGRRALVMRMSLHALKFLHTMRCRICCTCAQGLQCVWVNQDLTGRQAAMQLSGTYQGCGGRPDSCQVAPAQSRRIRKGLQLPTCICR